MKIKAGIKLLHRQSGDTIVEVLIAISIISLVLAGGYVVARSSQTAVTTSNERSAALQISQTEFESIRSLVMAGQKVPNGSFCIEDGAFDPVQGSLCHFDVFGNPTSPSTVPNYQVSMTTETLSTNPVITQVNIITSWSSFTNDKVNNVSMQYRLPTSSVAFPNLDAVQCGAGFVQVSGHCVRSCSLDYPYSQGYEPPYGSCHCISGYQGAPPVVPCTKIVTCEVYGNAAVGNCAYGGAAGGNYTFIVPAGVTSLTITADGSQGGDFQSSSGGNSGGKGGEVVVSLAVTPGESLIIQPGLAGPAGASNSCGTNYGACTSADTNGPGTTYLYGGNSGVSGVETQTSYSGCFGEYGPCYNYTSTNYNYYYGGAGGGASAVENSSGAPLVIAAGGGGAGSTTNYIEYWTFCYYICGTYPEMYNGVATGGAGGNLQAGGNGLDSFDGGATGQSGAMGGGGATATAGGTAQSSYCSTYCVAGGDPGSFLAGGAGGGIIVSSASGTIPGVGGGGGGGYWGGGGGSGSSANNDGGGGGGGVSFVGNGALDQLARAGANSGNGSVTIQWIP